MYKQYLKEELRKQQLFQAALALACAGHTCWGHEDPEGLGGWPGVGFSSFSCRLSPGPLHTQCRNHTRVTESQSFTITKKSKPPERTAHYQPNARGQGTRTKATAPGPSPVQGPPLSRRSTWPRDCLQGPPPQADTYRERKARARLRSKATQSERPWRQRQW